MVFLAKMQPFWYFNPPIPICPSGEQIVNGGFETGNFTGWTVVGAPIVQSGIVHSGSYAARLALDAIYQSLGGITVACLATAELWYYKYVIVRITFTDDTTWTKVAQNVGFQWAELDLLPTLQGTYGDKAINTVMIYEDGGVYIFVDDVSFMGKG